MARNDVFWSGIVSTPATDAAGVKSVDIYLVASEKRSNKPIPGRSILCTLDGIAGETKDTDAAGKVSFTVKHAGNDKPEAVFTCTNGMRKIMLDLTATEPFMFPTPMPEDPITPPTKPINLNKSKDPVRLKIHRTDGPAPGEYALFARVINITGYGIKDVKVEFLANGARTSCVTDKNGWANYSGNPIKLNPGDSLEIESAVSGIPGTTERTIFRRPLRDSANDRWDKYSRWALGGSFAVWIVALFSFSIFGWGDPLWSFSGLSGAEKIFNVEPGVPGSIWEVVKPPSQGTWQKPTFITLTFVLFGAFIYWLWRWRDELEEAWDKACEAFLKHYAGQAEDPLYQRISAIYGQKPTAIKTPQPAPTPGTTTPPTTGHPITHWDMLKTDLFAELVAMVVPSILKSLRGR